METAIAMQRPIERTINTPPETREFLRIKIVRVIIG
jgi:hypothetical protein